MARHRGTNLLITKGHLYVLQSAALPPDVFKIGMTTGSPTNRCADVSRQFGVSFDVIWSIPTSNVYKLESRVHRALAPSRLRPGHDLLNIGPLHSCTEVFSGLSLNQVVSVVEEAIEGFFVDSSWCDDLVSDPTTVVERFPALRTMPEEKRNSLLHRLAANDNQATAEFTLARYGTAARFRIGKTTYLDWSFGGKTRLWFDPTLPQCASRINQRRFDGDFELWTELLGPEVRFYEYRGAGGAPELKLVLWTVEHMEALAHVIDNVMPHANYLSEQMAQ